MQKNYKLGILCIIFFSSTQANPPKLMAYFMGNTEHIKNYPVDKLSHIIYSFLRLKGNKLHVDIDQDELILQTLVDLKQVNPNLKVIIAFGGWAGCESCSDVFSSDKNRLAFAKSVKKVLNIYALDGIDLDWEYPAIPGPDGHAFKPEDKQNFTALIQTLRTTLGENYEISFAAGVSKSFFEQSVEWEKVGKLINHVNLMTYDFVHGGSKQTGHLSNLYGTAQQDVSVDFAVKYLDSLGFDKSKIIIGAAFYGRIFTVFSQEELGDNILYKKGAQQGEISFRDLFIKLKQGFEVYWDDEAKAAYAYRAKDKTFITFDDEQSIAQKIAYIKDQNIGGIMFWELKGDTENGLLINLMYEKLYNK